MNNKTNWSAWSKKTTKQNVIIGHIYIWPMFFEPDMSMLKIRVLFIFRNVTYLFKLQNSAAFYENVYL